MSLQDFAPIAALSAESIARFQGALRSSGLSAATVEPLLAAARGVHPILRGPVLRHRARQEPGPHALAARAFLFGDPVPEAELASIGFDVEELTRAGLLVSAEGGLASPFTMALVDGLFLLSDPLDRGADAVMGMGPLTIPMCVAARPADRIGRAMDLGCGAGVAAALLSRRAARVVATDINPRALAMTEFNARLNQLPNVEVREGSLFEPVARERFDLVVSQPPFIPEAPSATQRAFMAGGSRGDELVRALLEALPDHLIPGGRGVVVAEWGHGPALESPILRVQKLLAGAPVDVLLFHYPEVRREIHATEYVAALRPELGGGYLTDTLERLGHLAAVGIEVLVPSLVVVRRVDDRKPRFTALRGSAIADARSERVDALLRAPEIVRSPDSLFGATLRLVPGAQLHPLPEPVRSDSGPAHEAVCELPPGSMMAPVPITAELAATLARFVEPTTVRGALDALSLSRPAGTPTGPDPRQALARSVAFALLEGLLEVV